MKGWRNIRGVILCVIFVTAGWKLVLILTDFFTSLGMPIAIGSTMHALWDPSYPLYILLVVVGLATKAYTVPYSEPTPRDLKDDMLNGAAMPVYFLMYAYNSFGYVFESYMIRTGRWSGE